MKFYVKGNILGFTLVELLITALLLTIVLAALFATLNVSHYSYSVTSTKLDLQSKVRLAMDWIVKDVRQSVSWNIASDTNVPSTTHLKFNLWTWNTTANDWDLSEDYIEYSYDPDLKKLARLSVEVAGNNSTIEFNDIDEAPFYTTYLGPGDASNVLDKNQLLLGQLIIVIRGRKNVRGSLYVPFNLMSEVMIRNG